MTNRYLAISLAIFVGPSFIFARGASASPTPMGGAALTSPQGQDDARREGQDQRRYQDDNDRNRDNDHRFRDRDRQAARDWYDHHRDHPPAGFREREWLAPEYESRMRVGYVLDPEMRRMARPVPQDLLYQLQPPPRHYRYVVIGGHVCLVDEGYRIHDVIHLEANLH
ncbi:MAG TPA: hypothetical protein VKV95_22105 [Terriglobia bacterium]|nr:hypothetical protein [Terriglobia bacterium]